MSFFQTRSHSKGLGSRLHIFLGRRHSSPRKRPGKPLQAPHSLVFRWECQRGPSRSVLCLASILQSANFHWLCAQASRTCRAYAMASAGLLTPSHTSIERILYASSSAAPPLLGLPSALHPPHFPQNPTGTHNGILLTSCHPCQSLPLGSRPLM